jgi:hypothetical protein
VVVIVIISQTVTLFLKLAVEAFAREEESSCGQTLLYHVALYFLF